MTYLTITLFIYITMYCRIDSIKVHALLSCFTLELVREMPYYRPPTPTSVGHQ